MSTIEPRGPLASMRVTVTLADATGIAPLLQVLHEHRADHEVEVPAGERVAVSATDDSVFLYADSRRSAESAEKIVNGLAANVPSASMAAA